MIRNNYSNFVLPQLDFRKRYRQRDLGISAMENNFLRENYLESLREEEERKKRKKAAAEAAKLQENNLKSDNTPVQKTNSNLRKEEPVKKTAADSTLAQQNDTTPNVTVLEQKKSKDTTNTVRPSELYKTPEGRKKNSPEEKLEAYFDIKLPTIQSLVEDYSKPFMYNEQTKKFEPIQDNPYQIEAARLSIANRPTPLGISDTEAAYMRATDPEVALMLGGNGARKLLDRKYKDRSDWYDDVVSTMMVNKNNAEFEAYVDAGIRLGEKQQYADIIQKYSDNIQSYLEAQEQYDRSGNARERNNLLVKMNNILAENEKIAPAMEEAVSYVYDMKAGGVARSLSDFINKSIPAPLQAIMPASMKLLTSSVGLAGQFSPTDVGQYGNQLLLMSRKYKFRPGTMPDSDFVNQFRDLNENIHRTNEQFLKESNEQILEDKNLALKNKQEAIDWEEWHTPSAEFKAKALAAQDNYLTDPDTYKYGIWGVVGSSMAFNGTQLLSTGLDWLGAGLLMAPHPYAKAGGLVATGAGGALGFVSGNYENRSEITNNYIEGLRESLNKEGKLDEFLSEGKKQLDAKGITYRDDQDIFRHFILKDYKSKDPIVNELALRHMFGANNAFQNDMMAVTSDVAINTGLNLFGATSKVAKALHIDPIPSGTMFAIRRAMAKSTLGKAVYRGIRDFSSNKVFSALSPLASIPYNLVVKPVVKGAKNLLAPMAERLTKHIDAALAWTKVAPKALFKAGAAKDYALDFLGKTAARGFSETIEEGKQYEYGKMFQEGKFRGKSNTIMQTLMDDLSTGISTGLQFIGGQFLGLESDRELLANMRGGFLGGILNHGTVISAAQDFMQARGEINAGDVIFNNVMAEKIRQRTNIVNGEEMAKYASRDGYAKMMNAFDRISKIHQQISEGASNRIGLDQDVLDEQRNMYRRIVGIANDRKVVEKAKRLGIDRNSADFRKLVSLINVADEIHTENVHKYNDLVQEAKDILAEDDLPLHIQNVFDMAQAMSRSDKEAETAANAREWAKWAHTLNNQIQGQYQALNSLIDDLEERKDYLTTAERRTLRHYKDQKDRLDHFVKSIQEQIGDSSNAQFLAYGNPETLTKYEQIYRTLYLASAQVDTSARILDVLYGDNDAVGLANEYVKEELDFINKRIGEESKKRKGALKADKEYTRDRYAIEILEQYKRSVADDIELMSELADRFDNRAAGTRSLGGEQNQSTNQGNPYSRTASEGPNAAERNGAFGLPVDIHEIAPLEADEHPVGTVLELPSLPGKRFTVTDIKINPSTGNFAVNMLNEDGEEIQVPGEEMRDYQRALPAYPSHYDTVLQGENDWMKFKFELPLHKAQRALEGRRNLPAVIERPLIPTPEFTALRATASEIFRTELQKTLKQPFNWNPFTYDPQRDAVEYLGELTKLDNFLVWNPIYGGIMDVNGARIYVPSYRDHVDGIYKEFDSKKRKRIDLVRRIQQLYDDNNVNELKKLFRDNGISYEYLNVLTDIQALNTVARMILDRESDHMKQWMSNLALYSDPQQLGFPTVKDAITKEGELLFTNVPFNNSVSSAYADAIVVDNNGFYRVYIFAFPGKEWTQEDWEGLEKGQQVSRKQFYESLADSLMRQMDPIVRVRLQGIYVLPITDSVLSPIALSTNWDYDYPQGIEIQRQIVQDYIAELTDQVHTFKTGRQLKVRQTPSRQNDGSQDTNIQEVEDSVKQVLDTIAGVYNGTFAFNGRIRSDARQYLEMQRTVLTKQRTFLRSMEKTDRIDSIIKNIEQAYQDILNILAAYPANRMYDAREFSYTGDTVDRHMPIIPQNHPLAARSTSGIPVTAVSDFITNGKVELSYGHYNTANGQFTPMNAYSPYPGVGVYATFTYDGVKYPPVMVQPAHYKNGVQPYTTEGALFVMDVITMQNQSEGLPIVAEARRMTPNPIWGAPVPVLSIQALHMTEDDLQELSGTSDTVGLANSRGNVQLIDKQDDKSYLWQFKATESGSYFLLHSFNFNEYPDGGIIPLKLIPAKLDVSDIDVVVSILKLNMFAIASGEGSIMNRKYKLQNGTETPFTNSQVLSMLMKYDMYANEQSMFYTDVQGRVYFKQRMSDNIQGPINVLMQDGEQTFRGLISNGYELAHSKEMLSGKLSDPRNKYFGELLSWVSQNGTLSISKNLTFDKDDVDRNGTGFYGIGWAIRKGRLMCNVSGIYEPSIVINDPAIDSNTTGPEVVQPASIGEEPKEHKNTESRFNPDKDNLLNTGFGFGGFSADFYATQDITEEPLDEQEAREDLARMLGDAAIEFKDEILGILKGGWKILGATLSNIMIISRKAPIGVQFHEAFHRIVELLFDEDTRNRVYQAYVNTHKDVNPSDPRSITEGLAEEFRAFANSEKYDSRLKKYFERIKRFCKALFNKDRRLLYKVYKNAYNGKYRNLKASKENVERFERLFKVENMDVSFLAYEAYNPAKGEYVNLPAVPNATDYTTAINTIVDNIISSMGANVFSSNTSKISLKKEDIAKLPFMKKILEKEKPDDIDKMFIDIYEHWDDLLNDISYSLKRFGLHFKLKRGTNTLETFKTNLSEKEEESIEDDEEKALTADIGKYTLQDYQISKLNKMSEKTKYFFATIPAVRFVNEEDGVPMYVPERNARGEEIDTQGRIVKTDPDTDIKYVELEDGSILTSGNFTVNMVQNIIPDLNEFGYPQFAPFFTTCNVALNHCYKVDDLYELLTEFRKLSSRYPVFTIIANRFASLLNDIDLKDKNGNYIATDGRKFQRMDNGMFRQVVGKDKYGTEWYTKDELEFKKNRNAQSMAVSIFNNISGTRLHFEQVLSTRLSRDKIVFLVKNTDNGYSARRYTQAWHTSFLDDINKVEPVQVHKKGDVIVEYRPKNANLFKNAADNLRIIIDAFTNRRSQGWKTGEIKVLGKTIKINKNPDQVKGAYIQILNSIGILITRDQFDHLLFELAGKTDAKALRKYFQQDGEDFGQTRGVSLPKFVLAVEQGVNNGGFLSRTVASGTLYTKTGVSLQLANAIWSFNQQESELMMSAPGKNKYYGVANRNVQDIFMQDLNIPHGQFIRDYKHSAYISGSILIDKLDNGEVYLISTTDAGYESDNKSDYGSDFMKITDAEDVISKITMLIENRIIPPTLSNKKTYQPIQVINSATQAPVSLPGIQYVVNKDNAQTEGATAEAYKATNLPVLVDKTFNGKFIMPSKKLGTESKYITDKQFILPSEVYDALIRYAFSEYESVKQGIERQAKVPDSEKVVNFDTATKGANHPGATRFARFYELYIPREDGDGGITYDTILLNDDSEGRTAQDNLDLAYQYFFGPHVSYEQRVAMLNEIIERNFDKNLNYFINTGIIKYRSGWRDLPKYYRYEPVAIDLAHLNAIITAFGRSLPTRNPEDIRSVAVCTLLLDVCMKHQIGMEEYQRLFAGHPGLYVSLFEDGHVTDDTGDLSKRLGGHSSTGETQCKLEDVPEEYNCAELCDYKTTSSQKRELDGWFEESEARSVLYNAAQKDISIQIQKIRSRVKAVVVRSFGRKYSDSRVRGELGDILDAVDTRTANVIVNNIVDISNSKAKSIKAVQELFDVINIIIDEYKYDVVSKEYKDQENLKLSEVMDRLSLKKLLTGVQARVAAYQNNYDKKINVADGASYVSPQMVKWMLQSIGKFNGRVEKAWELLQSDEFLSPLQKAEEYNMIMEALFGTLKYTATGVRMNNGQPITYYNKTAFFPLFKQVAYGRTKDILDKMLENNVHVLMFESAVKFGSQGKQIFPTTAEGLKAFAFNVYKQKMKYLRKQLNTDPKEADLMTVGSQTKKVAMTILDIYKDDYIKADGTKETGMDLRDRIFECERELAKLGWKDISERFSSEEEMAMYIRDNLSDRDADSDTLEGLNLKEDDDTGEKHMESPLEGLSNGEWIQSIITSLGNKHIVDVNLPGAAFIQRSVYAMENGSILGDNLLPNIPKLKISNDWSSMDAVVSIDYFYQQFPFLEDMSFDEARQWLINHNIIGENAKADTVAYRIPTQAASSIHALRFVDVISTVRDTIILPEEFTAITGSDFDIDKLFLSTKYYNFDEAVDKVSTTFDKNIDPKKFYGNTLMDCYLELLTQPKNKYANQLVRSIDYDTEIPMKVVKLLKQGQVIRIGTYDALLLYRQCLIKAQNRTGGMGVGPYALNNNNEIMTMAFEVECENVGIVKALDISRLYDRLDAEGDSVLATVGAFISGHVDIAKNPWVTILNVNEYTYDIHIYLARAGLGLRSLWFCAQPIMRKAALVYIQSGGYLFDAENTSSYTRRQRAFEQFEKDYLIGRSSWYKEMIDLIKEYGNFAEANAMDSQQSLKISGRILNALYIIQQIFGVDPKDPSIKINTFKYADGKEGEGTILLDIALHHNEESDIFDPTGRYLINMPVVKDNGNVVYEDTPISVKDVQFFVWLANLLIDDPVSDMKKLVQLSKIETKKQGKNRAQQLAYSIKFDDFFVKGNTKIMRPDTVKRMATDSGIYIKQMLFDRATKYMLQNQLLQYTPAYEQFVSDFIRYASLRKDANTIKAILNGISAWQKYQFIKGYASLYDINMRDLFVGPNSIYNTLSRLRSNILAYPEIYRRYTDGNGKITNALLAKLQPSDIPGYVLKEYGDSLPKFVDFQISQSDSAASTTDIKRGWAQMLTDEAHPDIVDFARRLVVYAFMTSGDTNRFGSFFKNVPMIWRKELSADESGHTYIGHIKTLLMSATTDGGNDPKTGGYVIDPDSFDEETNTDVYDQILLNNWFDDDLVPTINETSKDILGRTVANYFEYMNNGEAILVALVKLRVDGNGAILFLQPSFRSPKAVIKIHKQDHDSYRNPQDFKLYRFLRMGTVVNEDNKLISFPIYERVSPTGGLMYGHSIIQYGDKLGFGWETETKGYSQSLDDRFREGMYLMYKYFDHYFKLNQNRITSGEYTSQQLKEFMVAGFPNIPITGQFEDGTPVEITASSSSQFYSMAQMMAKYLMLHPGKESKIEDTYHNNSLLNIKRVQKKVGSSRNDVIQNWMNIRLTELTATHGVTLSTQPNTFMQEWQTWLLNNQGGIVAYRVRDDFNTPEAVEQGIIGNPFNWTKMNDVKRTAKKPNGEEYEVPVEGLAVNLFFDWIVNGNDHDEPDATEPFRRAIIKKIMETDKPNIFYDKELNQHSHATALGYIIEHKKELFSSSKSILLVHANFDRKIAEANPKTLYIFTDNAVNRSSGKNLVDPQSWYALKYANGRALYYPNPGNTQAVLRGLPNAYPVSTQKHYDPANGLTYAAGNWKASDIDQFKLIVDDEFNDIFNAIRSGKYDTVALGMGDAFFNSKISDIRETGERADMYSHLKGKVEALEKLIEEINTSGTKPVENEQPKTKTIDIDSRNQDKYSNLTNPAGRVVDVTPFIKAVVKDVTGQDLLDRIANLYDVSSFKSVEQMFLMIKFEYMKDHIYDKAKQLFDLDRKAKLRKGDESKSLISSKSEEAVAIRRLLKVVNQKQQEILKASGTKVITISHEPLPDIYNIIGSFWEEKWNEGGTDNYRESTSYKIIREIMLQSFLQNEGAAKLLLSTGDITLTHSKGSVYWKNAFPDALMSVRQEISENLDKLQDLHRTALNILGGDKIAYEEIRLAVKAAKEGKRFSDVAPFFTEEEANQIKSSMTPREDGSYPIRVDSVFRNNDAAMFSADIVNALRENAKLPMTDPSRINVVEIWSKHDGIAIQNILEACKKYRVAPIVSFSITGMGDTALEKGVMKYGDMLDAVEKLVNVGILDPRTTTIRIDPILPGISSLGAIKDIIERCVKMGVRKFVTSPMQTYSVQKNRDGSPRTVIPHIDAALKADPQFALKYPDAITADGTYDWMKYYGLHYDQRLHPGAIAFAPKKEVMTPYADLFQLMMAKYDITIQSCTLPIKGLTASACLDPEIIEAVTTINPAPIADTTRSNCKCYGNHGDLFRFMEPCFSNCTYCYRGWGAGNNILQYYNEDGTLKDMGYTKVNRYDDPDLKVTATKDAPEKVAMGCKDYTYDGTTVTDEAGNIVDNTTRTRVIWQYAINKGIAQSTCVNGVWYVATVDGIIFNWNTGHVENIADPTLKHEIFKGTQKLYEKPRVTTVFNAQELKELGESRKKFCKSN